MMKSQSQHDQLMCVCLNYIPVSCLNPYIYTVCTYLSEDIITPVLVCDVFMITLICSFF